MRKIFNKRSERFSSVALRSTSLKSPELLVIDIIYHITFVLYFFNIKNTLEQIHIRGRGHFKQIQLFKSKS